MYSLTTDTEIASGDPQRHQELMEYSQEVLAKREPELYKNYKEVYCLECSSPREIPISRYCTKHYNLYTKKQLEDRRTGKVSHRNYGYSMEGWNEGMNAYVHDKWHFAKLQQRFKTTENLEVM